MPPAPPDLFGIGKVLAIAATLLFAIRVFQSVRNWYGKRRRQQILRAQELAKRRTLPDQAAG